MINAYLPPFLATLTPGQHTPCHGHADVFVGARTETGRAKALCNTCPIQQACAEHAIRTGEPAGIWGGLTPAERRARTVPPCGTEAAWRRHALRHERCTQCREAHAERLAEDRRARLAQEHAQHGGSIAGYRLELVLGLPTCDRCRAARRDYYRARPRRPARKWYRRTNPGMAQAA